MNNRPTVRIAVIDYDDCASAPAYYHAATNSNVRNSHPYYLSELLLADIKQKDCHAFYGCTHRVTGTTYNAAACDPEFHSAVRDLHQGKYFVRHRLTSSITEHLMEALGFACLAVSTPDDFIKESTSQPLDICGYGYRQYLKPHEQKLVTMNQYIIDDLIDPRLVLHPEIPDELYDLYSNPEFKKHIRIDGKNCKNAQLQMVAEHACKKFPESNIELFFYDDDLEICDAAVKYNQLPSNVVLHVYNHVAYERTLRYVGTARSIKVSEGGLFAQSKPVAEEKAVANQSKTYPASA